MLFHYTNRRPNLEKETPKCTPPKVWSPTAGACIEIVPWWDVIKHGYNTVNQTTPPGDVAEDNNTQAMGQLRSMQPLS
jgi:hypothetical protein